MRSGFAISCLSVLGALAGTLALTLGSCGGAAGHLTAEPASLDFGLVVIGQNMERRLRVKNEGKKGVVITAAAPSCKCLEVDPSFQRSLQPGESTEIRVRLVTGNLTPQKFDHKRLEVNSDDPAATTLFVMLHGEVVHPLTLVPTMVRVGPDDAAGRGEPRRIKLRTPQGITAELQRVEVSRPEWFTVTPEANPEGVDLVLRVTKDEARRGPVDATVKLHVRVTGRGLPPQVQTQEVRIQGTW